MVHSHATKMNTKVQILDLVTVCFCRARRKTLTGPTLRLGAVRPFTNSCFQRLHHDIAGQSSILADFQDPKEPRRPMLPTSTTSPQRRSPEIIRRRMARLLSILHQPTQLTSSARRLPNIGLICFPARCGRTHTFHSQSCRTGGASALARECMRTMQRSEARGLL